MYARKKKKRLSEEYYSVKLGKSRNARGKAVSCCFNLVLSYVWLIIQMLDWQVPIAYIHPDTILFCDYSECTRTKSMWQREWAVAWRILDSPAVLCHLSIFYLKIKKCRAKEDSGTRCQNTSLDANCLTQITCRRLLCIHSRDQTFSVHEAAGNSLLVSGPVARLKDCEVLAYPGLSPNSRALLRGP